MKNSSVYILAFALLAVAVSACRKNEPVEAGELISFSADASAVEDVAATRATKTVAKNLTDNPFGVYGVYSSTKGDTKPTNVFDNSSALKVEYNSTSKGWEYSRTTTSTQTKTKYYWKRNSYYRFRAYHPYSASVETGGSSADGILINYRIVEDQYDLLVGFATRRPNDSTTLAAGIDSVRLQFHHALSALRFRVAFEKSVDEGTTDVLTEFHITGVMAAGMLKYSHKGDYLTESLSWSSDAFDSSHEFYKYEDATGRTFGVYNPGAASSVEPVDIYGSSDADNIVFAIPQTCSDPQYGNTVIHFKTTGGGDVDNTVVLPSIDWVPGKIYTYTLLIKRSSVKVVVSIKDWNEVESTVDINI